MNPRHLDGLEEALSYGGGEYALGDVLRQILSGEAQLWENEHALIVTQVFETPRKKTLHFWLATGELEEVIRLSEVALRWGGESGCDRASLAGRKGWQRALVPHGWTPELVLMGRAING